MILLSISLVLSMLSDPVVSCHGGGGTTEQPPTTTEEPPTTTTFEPCLQDLSKGPCGKAFTRFYFNQELQKCQSFEYSGCGGNFNNFMTKHECEAICLNITSSVIPETVSTVAKFDFNNGFPPLWNVTHMVLEYSDPIHKNVSVGANSMDMGLMESEFDLKVITPFSFHKIQKKSH